MDDLNQEILEARLRYITKLALDQEKNSIMSMMGLEYVRANVKDHSWISRLDCAKWMGNFSGHMHGGVSATVLDFAMGALAHCVTDQEGSTSSLQVSYLKPVVLDQPLFIQAHVTHAGHRLVYTTAIAWQEDQEDPVLSATAVFYMYKGANQRRES